MEGGLSPDELASMAHSLMAAKMFSLASCVMLYYDIALTFGQEVERIWMRKLSFMTVLWCMNRYLSPLGYIVIIVSFHSSWSKEVCNNYVLYPEALKVITSFAIGVIFITRLYAIYSQSLCILILGTCLLALELAVKIYAFTDGTSLQMPPGFVGCILVGKHHGRFVLTWIAELVFDSAVFFLTFWRTAMHSRSVRGHGASLYDLVLRDGVIYFAVIFAANLMTVLFFLLAPPNLKAINASFSTLITSLMVSRLILNLRDAAVKDSVSADTYFRNLPYVEESFWNQYTLGNGFFVPCISSVVLINASTSKRTDDSHTRHQLYFAAQIESSDSQLSTVFKPDTFA